MESVIKLVILDVYGTILDMADVKKKVNKILDSKRGYTIWTEILLHYSLVDNHTTFHPFAEIARSAMGMAAEAFDVSYTDESMDKVLELMEHLPLKENAQDGLSLFQDYNYKLAALTNFSSALVSGRMERTGLVSYFDKIISAEEVKKYKPAIESYQYAAKKGGHEAHEVLVVSTHGWDVAGASKAGMKTAFIETGGEYLYPLAPKPDYIAKDLASLAKQVVSR
jgi:2-haloacid dehalogenase